MSWHFQLITALKDDSTSAVIEIINQLSIDQLKEAIDREGRTALHIACQHSSKEIIKFILNKLNEEAATITALPDNNGWTPLHFAALYKNEEEILLLLKLLGERATTILTIFNKDGWAPIHLIARYQSAQVITRVFNDYGWAKINQIDPGYKEWNNFKSLYSSIENLAILPTKDGWTSLHLTILNSASNATSALINTWGNKAKKIINYIAFESHYAEFARVMKEMFNHMSDFSSYEVSRYGVNRLKCSPLHLAIECEKYEIVSILLSFFNTYKYYSDFSFTNFDLLFIPNKEGYVPLALAASIGNLEIVKLLLNSIGNILTNNASLRYDFSRQRINAIESAKKNNHIDIIAYLENFVAPLPKDFTPAKEKSVLIRMWLPKYNKQRVSLFKALFNPGDNTNIGHISISIRDDKGETYISHWPQEKPSNPLMSTPGTNNTLLEDLDCEEGMPDEQIVLYSLDTAKMVSYFKEIGQNARWFIGGGKSIQKKLGKDIAHSCSSYVYELLMQGGIFNHVLPDKERLNSPVTPAEVAQLAKKAQQAERILYPETSDFLQNELADFAAQLIAKSKEGFKPLNTFIQINPDYCYLYTTHHPDEATKLSIEIRNNIKEAATKELLNFVQTFNEQNETITKNIILPHLDYLLQLGADLNLRNEIGYNALHCLIKMGNLRCIEKLLSSFPEAINNEIIYPELKQDINKTNSHISSILFPIIETKKGALPVTPLDLAIDLGSEKIIKFLQEKGGATVTKALEHEYNKNFYSQYKFNQ